MQGAGAESAGAQRRAKPFHRIGANRLRAVVSHVPTAEVERFTLFRRNSTGAQFIREIGASAARSLAARKGLEPPYRSHEKGNWRHQVTRTSVVHRLDDPIGEAHVMKGPSPAHGETGCVR